MSQERSFVMGIKELLIPLEVDYNERKGNLDVEASGVVKSKKYFPIYEMNGKNVIFKPLSKTKPLTTEFFSYAEVYWSYVINRFFDKRTPLYRLAKCRNIEEKYYGKGTLVEKIGSGNFTNLLEYFNMHPENGVDIKDYVNYCMIDYDYTGILESNFIKSNESIGSELAFQILLSILRMDQNFHYENVNLDEKNNFVPVPPIDFEFSTPFLYPEDLETRHYYINKYFNNLVFPTEMHQIIRKSLNLDFVLTTVLMRNIFIIVRDYPDVVDRFLECLDNFYNHIDDIELSDDYSFIGEVSSDYWNVGHAKYKLNDTEKYEELKKKIKKTSVDKDRVFELIKQDNKRISERLKSIIKSFRLFMEHGYTDLEDMTMDKLYFILGMDAYNKQNVEHIDYEGILKKVLEY